MADVFRKVQVAGYAVVQGNAYRIHAVHCFRMGIEHVLFFVHPPGIRGEGFRSQFPPEVQNPVQLGQDDRLPGFVGMELQAERIQADLIQPFLDNLERRLLFGHEEHPLALVKRIGDNVGNGLALAGSGRAVHDETAPGNGIPDGIKLG